LNGNRIHTTVAIGGDISGCGAPFGVRSAQGDVLPSDDYGLSGVRSPQPGTGLAEHLHYCRIGYHSR